MSINEHLTSSILLYLECVRGYVTADNSSAYKLQSANDLPKVSYLTLWSIVFVIVVRVQESVRLSGDGVDSLNKSSNKE